MAQAKYISVILPLRLEWVPCYAVPEEMCPIEVGDRVRVIFANRQYSGVVVETGITPDTDPKKIRPIISVYRVIE